MRILIVDDEPMELELFRMILLELNDKWEYIGVALDGKRALDLVPQVRPDVIFMDVKMPILNGIMASKLIKDQWPGIQIVIVSAYDEFSFARDALEVGVVSYLLKPVERVEVEKVLAKLLSRFRGDAPISNMWNEDKTQGTDALTQIIHYISNHIHEDLSLRSIAECVNFHPTYVSRMFKREFGIGVSEYVTRARIQHAQFLLIRYPKMSIQDIAAHSGFGSQHYFTTVFRNLEGLTPTEFRARHRLSNKS